MRLTQARRGTHKQLVAKEVRINEPAGFPDTALGQLVKLIANYAKKLGLPGYSSHQYSVTIKTEVTDPAHVAEESGRLYDLLQSCVDREIQKTGFLPQRNDRGNGGTGGFANNNNGAWSCSPKQRDLILDIVDRNQFDKTEVEKLAQERFGKGVKQLNKLEASGLIDQLIEKHDKTGGNGERCYGNQRFASTGGRLWQLRPLV